MLSDVRARSADAGGGVRHGRGAPDRREQVRRTTPNQRRPLRHGVVRADLVLHQVEPRGERLCPAPLALYLWFWISLSLSLSLSLSRSLSLPSLDFSTKVPSRQGFLRSISSLSLAKFGGMPHKFQSAKYANFFFPSVFGGVWGGCAPSSALL